MASPHRRPELGQPYRAGTAATEPALDAPAPGRHRARRPRADTKNAAPVGAGRPMSATPSRADDDLIPTEVFTLLRDLGDAAGGIPPHARTAQDLAGRLSRPTPRRAAEALPLTSSEAAGSGTSAPAGEPGLQRRPAGPAVDGPHRGPEGVGDTGGVRLTPGVLAALTDLRQAALRLRREIQASAEG